MGVEVCVQTRAWYGLLSKPVTNTKNVLEFALEELKIKHYSPVVFVVLGNDTLLQELNLRYKNIDAPTNVLSFNYEELAPNCCLGEIYISAGRIRAESREMNIESLHHFTHMLIHGMLHILGYDHIEREDEIVMQSMEVKLLEKLGIGNPYVV